MELAVNYIGSIKNKPSMIDILNKYGRGLNMLSVIHMAGAKKYQLYSWINNPEKSNSTIEDNLNAIYRHFSAHSMGKIIDEEGFPHIFHMCCRAGMLITTYYRLLQRIKSQYKDIRKYNTEYLGYLSNLFITPKELYSLSKWEYPSDKNIQKVWDIPKDEVELRSFINAQLIFLLYDYKHITENIKKVDTSIQENRNILENDFSKDYNILDRLFRTILVYSDLVFTKDMFKLIDRDKIGTDLWIFVDQFIN